MALVVAVVSGNSIVQKTFWCYFVKNVSSEKLSLLGIKKVPFHI